MEEYFKRALDIFPIDIAFNLVLLKYKARSGLLLYEVSCNDLISFDTSLYVKKIEFWTFVSLTEIPSVETDYEIGVFLGYITPLKSLQYIDTTHCTHVLDIKVNNVSFLSQIIDIKDFETKFYKIFNTINNIAQQINCKVSYKLTPYLNSHVITNKVECKDIQWIKDNEDEIVNTIWNTGFERTTDYFKYNMNRVEQDIDFLIELVRFHDKLKPMTEEQYNKAIQITDEYDKQIVFCIEERDIDKLKKLLCQYIEYCY